MKTRENAVRGAILGLACGDALGAPLENMTREQIQTRHGTVVDMIGGGWLNVSPGQVTDDTEMMLAVGWGVLASPASPIDQIGRRFIKWYDSRPIDVGNTTVMAMEMYKECGCWAKVGRQMYRLCDRAAGNGALMRTLPLSLVKSWRQETMVERSIAVTRMTHPASIAFWSSTFYNILVRLAAEDTSRTAKTTLLDGAEAALVNPLERTWLTNAAGDGLRPTGYSLDTLACALWVWLHTETFEACVVEAVNLGGDADTIGAVAGGLAGAYYGAEAIPGRWLNVLHKRDELERLAAALV